MIATTRIVRSVAISAAFAAGAALMASAGHAGNAGSIGAATGQVQGTTVLQMAPLKCERTTSPAEFPYARITNVSGAAIKKGKTIAYKFGNGLHSQLTLTADLPNQGSVVTSQGTDAGYKCTATLL